MKSLEILFRFWKHIFGKNYLENQKIKVLKFVSNVQNLSQNWAEIVLKTYEAERKILQICIKIKNFSEKFRNIV